MRIIQLSSKGPCKALCEDAHHSIVYGAEDVYKEPAGSSCKAGNRWRDPPTTKSKNPEIRWMLMPNDLTTWPLLLGRRCERYQEFLRSKSARAKMRLFDDPFFQQLFQRVLSSLSLSLRPLYFVCVLSNCSRCSKEKINNQPLNNETDQLSGSQLTSSNSNFLSSFGPLAMLLGNRTIDPFRERIFFFLFMTGAIMRDEIF